MGHEDAAEEAMQNCIRVHSKDSVVHGREGALQPYIMFALDCGKPRKTDKFDDELLVIVANHVNLLTVKMLVHAEDKDVVQARDYGRRIPPSGDRRLVAVRDGRENPRH